MIIEYDVCCFERTLVVEFPEGYEHLESEIVAMLNEYYVDWHDAENIADPDERLAVQDTCLEEYMMDRLSETYNMWEEWDSFYYGDDEDEIADDRSKKINSRNWNIHWFRHTLGTLEALRNEFEAFEKLGNDAYHILNVCIAQLENLKEEI